MGRNRSKRPRRYVQLASIATRWLHSHPYTAIATAVTAVAVVALWVGVHQGSPLLSAQVGKQGGARPQLGEPIFRLLNGKPVATDDEARTRSVGVMIENLPSTRPQAGLGAASVVYETLVEGGATRFLALFPIRDIALSRIGPVRSIRPYYLDWLVEYKGVLAHAGGSPEGLSKIYQFNVPSLNAIAGDGKYYWRERSIAAPHNLFTSSEKLQNALDDSKRKTKTFVPWHFKDDIPIASRPRDDAFVRIKFSSFGFETEFRYRRQSNDYARFNAGQPHTDALTGEQIQTKNVIVQVIPPIVSIGEQGRLTLDIYGEGRAFIFVDGMNHVGTWKKDDRTSRTEFFFADGTPAQLNRGNTWVEVVPEDRVVEAGV